MVGWLALVGLTGCAAPPRGPALPPGFDRPLPSGLDARAMIGFDDLPALEPLGPATEDPARLIPDEALKRYLAGLALARAYRDSEALKHFEAAIQADPQASEPRVALAYGAMQAAQVAKAAEALREAVRLRPDHAQAHYLLGVASLALGEDAAGLRHLRDALALMGDGQGRARVWFHLAQALERQGYLRAAVETCGKFESSTSGAGAADAATDELVAGQAWRVPALRAGCLRRLGQTAAAVEAYRQALRMQPEQPEVQMALAETLIDADQLDEAAQLAEQVLAANVRDAEALAVLAATLAGRGRFEDLETRLVDIVRANQADALVAQRCAAVLLKFARRDAALQVLHIARKSAQEPAGVYAAMLQVVLAYDDLDTAVSRLAELLGGLDAPQQDLLLAPRAALDVNPQLARDVAGRGAAMFEEVRTDAVRMFALAVVAEAAGEMNLSDRALRAALSLQPDSVQIAVALAERLLARARWQEAIRLAEPLQQAHPDVGALYRVIGAAYDGLDDYKAAMANLYEALKRNQRDAQAMWLAAQINERLAQPQPATAIYQALAVVKPDFWPAHLALVRNYLLLRQAPAAAQHAQRLKGLYPDVPAVDLCVLMAEAGQAVPASGKVEALRVRHPDDPYLLRAAGEAYLAEGRAADAFGPLCRLLRRMPQDEEARLLLTTALARQLEFDLAEEVLKSLLAEHPNRHVWRLAHAELLAQAGKPTEALPILRDLLALSWPQEQADALSGRMLFNLQFAGLYDAAVGMLQQDLGARPKDRGTQMLLLGVLDAAGRRAEAVRLLAAWRAGAPDDPLLKRMHVQFLLATDRQEEASAEAVLGWPGAATTGAAGRAPSTRPSDQDLLLLAASLEPEEVTAWLACRAWQPLPELTAATMAQMTARQGRYLEAAELAALVRASPEGAAQRAQWLMLGGRRAEPELLILPQLQEQDEDLHERLGRMLSNYYKRMGLDRLSLRATEQMYRRFQDQPGRVAEFGNDLAYVWAEMGVHLAEAQDLARHAVGREAGNAAYQDTLAWVYYKCGRFDQALRWLEQAVRVPKEGRDPVLYDHLGDVYWRLGRRDEAVRAWRTAEQLFEEEAKAGSTRPDLAAAAITRHKLRAAREGRQPPVAGWAGEGKVNSP